VSPHSAATAPRMRSMVDAVNVCPNSRMGR
jgi:hypothetical protein